MPNPGATKRNRLPVPLVSFPGITGLRRLVGSMSLTNCRLPALTSWWTTGVGVVIGIDEVDETIVLAFRGTINIRNWIVK